MSTIDPVYPVTQKASGTDSARKKALAQHHFRVAQVCSLLFATISKLAHSLQSAPIARTCLGVLT